MILIVLVKKKKCVGILYLPVGSKNAEIRITLKANSGSSYHSYPLAFPKS